MEEEEENRHVLMPLLFRGIFFLTFSEIEQIIEEKGKGISVFNAKIMYIFKNYFYTKLKESQYRRIICHLFLIVNFSKKICYILKFLSTFSALKKINFPLHFNFSSLYQLNI